MSNGKPKASEKPAVSDRGTLADIQRKLRNLNRGSSDVADWSGVSSEKVLAVIHVVAEAGCAVTFGKTRDGGAYTLRILGIEGLGTFYVRPSENVEETLRWIHESFTETGTIG